MAIIRERLLLAVFFILNILHIRTQIPSSCSWSNAFYNILIYGGQGNPASSLPACQTVCQQTIGCQGIDWAPTNPVGQQCFTQVTQSGKSMGNGVTHYDYTCSGAGNPGMNMYPSPNAPKPCVDSYTSYPQTVSPGGLYLTEVNNFDDCVGSCSDVIQCSAMDYSESNGCWVHMNVSDLSKTYYQSDATQVRIKKCSAVSFWLDTCYPTYSGNTLISICGYVCFAQWLQVDDTVGSGGIPYSTQPGNATACIAGCLYNIPNCVGVDWVYTGPTTGDTCSYYTTFTMSAMTTTTIQANAVQYRLVSPCAQYCQVQYTPFTNTRFHLLNVTMRLDITTSSACSNACITSPICSTYQVSNSGPTNCILAQNVFNHAYVTDITVSTYIWTPINCNGTTLPPPPATISTSTALPPTLSNSCLWSNPYNNILIYGGQTFPASSLPACMIACQQTVGCQGVDWAPTNSAGQQCFTQTTQAGKYPGTGVTHYDYTC